MDGWMNRAETAKTEMCNICSVKVVYMRLKTAYLILRLCFGMKCSCLDVSSPVVDVVVVGGGGVDGCRNWDNGSRKTNDRKFCRKFSLIVVAMARIMMMAAVVVVTTVAQRSSDEYIYGMKWQLLNKWKTGRATADRLYNFTIAILDARVSMGVCCACMC